ncbi:MAG: phosphomethylpyrimidine synthase ThiC [Syntrophomonadaceae bacterium]|nr:phosphomethylpyrimidine synthase ThiC [Syntrophomonadaceae bacterium]
MKHEDTIRTVAAREGVSVEELAARVRAGRVTLLHNPEHHGVVPCGVGDGLAAKVNVNLGVSAGFSSLDEELAKLEASLKAGADTVMDLSLGPDIRTVRRAVLERSPVPVGTVPVYQAAFEAGYDGGLASMTSAGLLRVVEEQVMDGVDFITVHCGITRSSLETAARGRLMGVVSRGGALLAAWMKATGRENPLFEQFDWLLDLAAATGVTLSLGDSLRPGCIADGSDGAQVQELVTLGELVGRARARGINVLVEGPGHMSLDQVADNVRLQKRLCHGAPYYVLGPLVTDIAPGYDHITAAIGGAAAVAAGADFLCVVTPAEHLGLPTRQDLVDGVVAARIAAHAGDLVRLRARAAGRDEAMATARSRMDWETQFSLALDPERCRLVHSARAYQGESGCSMCGEYCSLKVFKEGVQSCAHQ